MLVAMPAWMPEAWNRLSADNQKKAETIIQVLLTQLEDEKPAPKKRKLGVLSDRFISMSDDFNEPLEAFKEYM